MITEDDKPTTKSQPEEKCAHDWDSGRKYDNWSLIFTCYKCGERVLREGD